MKDTLLDPTKWGFRSPWVVGQLFIWAGIFLGSLILAFLIHYSSLETKIIPTISYLINALSLLVGGFMSGRTSGHKGWYYGGLQGIIYVLLVMMIGFLAFDSSMAVNPLLFACSAFGLSAIGGIIGVNTAD